jgi:phosphatidylserine/phosphatidylglycerophosphate/cardiolipin synthase-like enzyme
MRKKETKGGLTVQAVAGTYNVVLGFDLTEAKREGCLGFSIWRTLVRTDKGPVPKSKQQTRPLPNNRRFACDKPEADENGKTKMAFTDTAPLQKFRWGDYVAEPGHTYVYKVQARYGEPCALSDDGPTVEIEVTTEDPSNPKTAIFFNRGAAASQAYNKLFGDKDPEDLPAAEKKKAYDWLSRGLEDALLKFMRQAEDSRYALHACIYEFQKDEFLEELKEAQRRHAVVEVVYHFRQKPPVKNKKTGKLEQKDLTCEENEEAAKKHGLASVSVKRKANPQGAIMHNKFVVLLKRDASGDFEPQAVWTGSTNWTDGGVYGQLNVGHAVYDKKVARAYEDLFQLLNDDTDAAPLKKALAELSPVPEEAPPGPVVMPIFSPQSDLGMLNLYASISEKAKFLMVCAPFELSPIIRKALAEREEGVLKLMLLDKRASLGKEGAADGVGVIEKAGGNMLGVAATLDSSLSKFQKELLGSSEHFHHRGIHIHSKFIIADPFGDAPVLVTGSANFSKNSTSGNDSNSLLICGGKAAGDSNRAVIDIYATEFLRMFEHYHYRGTVAQKQKLAKEKGAKFKEESYSLKDSDVWTNPYYKEGTTKHLSRLFFSGTSK